MARIKIYIEVASKDAFACALDWPGWARAAKTQERAIEALDACAQRYAPVSASAAS